MTASRMLLAVWSLAIAMFVGPAVAHAQNDPPGAATKDDAQAKARAKVHFERGIAAYKEGRYKDAIDAFLDAHREFPSPSLSFNTARAYEKMGDSAGALRFYREYLRQLGEPPDRAAVEARVSELEGKLQARGVQQVTVLSQPEGATVILDDRPLGVTPWTGEILPGGHRIRLRREGYTDKLHEFTLPAHRAMDVELSLDRAARETAAPTGDVPAAPTVGPLEADHAPSRGIGITTWVSLGVGVAALATAGLFEVLRARSEEDVRAEETQVARHDAFERMESRQTLSRVFAGVGAAAMIAGGVLLYFDLTAESAPTRAGVGFGCDPSGCAARMEGRF
jgi:tetratricopeptide (TPR) repeat protein